MVSILITWSWDFFFNCLENCLPSARLFPNRTLLTSCCNYSKATSPVGMANFLPTALGLASSRSCQRGATTMVKAQLAWWTCQTDWQPGANQQAPCLALPALRAARHSWLLVFNVVSEGAAGQRSSLVVDGSSCVREALPQDCKVRKMPCRWMCYTDLTSLKLKYIVHNLRSKDKNVG